MRQRCVTATTNRFNSADYLDTPDSPVTNLTAGGRCFAYVAGTVSGVTMSAQGIPRRVTAISPAERLPPRRAVMLPPWAPQRRPARDGA